MNSSTPSLNPVDSVGLARLPFWLPPLLELDWQARYQSGLAALREAEVGIRDLEDQFRQLQKALASRQRIRTCQDEQNLGMWSLAGAVDAAALSPREGDDWDQTPLACLFSEVGAGPGLEQDRITPLLGQAARHFTLLLKEEPADVLALYYRTRVRCATVRFIQLRQLPLNDQQLVYTRRYEYIRAIESALDDAAATIAVLIEGFEQDGDGLIMPLRTGNRNQQAILNQTLYECYVMQAGLKQQQRKWADAVAAVSAAIALRPRKISLYLERAALYHRLGQFELEARDCIITLKVIAHQIPTGQMHEFNQKLNYLELETDSSAVIQMVMSFWAANPMLLLS